MISSSSTPIWFHSPQVDFSSHLSVFFPMESIVLDLKSLNHWSYFLMPQFSRPLNCNYFLNSIIFFLNSLLRVLSFRSHSCTPCLPTPPAPASTQFNYRPRLSQQSPNLSSNSRFPHSYGGIKISRILLISCGSKMWLWEFLVVQWLRLHAPNAGGPVSIPGQGTGSHMLQIKVLHATTKAWHSQINKYLEYGSNQ